ncbi:conserved hypothetical protein [Ricinus communis]|uniref:Uncharacterized protein n=1 Tax=Ricinus communis TaxID=3988 RepID=B9SVL2_RICCO|nr:conserved hypothetical protein [Ricinus communis]
MEEVTGHVEEARIREGRVLGVRLISTGYSLSLLKDWRFLFFLPEAEKENGREKQRLIKN